MEIETRAATLFVLDLARILGVVECSQQSPQEVGAFEEEELAHQRNLIRLLTPVCKLYTAKQVRFCCYC